MPALLPIFSFLKSWSHTFSKFTFSWVCTNRMWKDCSEIFMCLFVCFIYSFVHSFLAFMLLLLVEILVFNLKRRLLIVNKLYRFYQDVVTGKWTLFLIFHNKSPHKSSKFQVLNQTYHQGGLKKKEGSKNLHCHWNLPSVISKRMPDDLDMWSFLIVRKHKSWEL